MSGARRSVDHRWDGTWATRQAVSTDPEDHGVGANLAGLLLAQAVRRPGLRLGVAGEAITLEALMGRAGGVAMRLGSLGAGPQGRVALVAGNATDYLVVWVGALLAGVPPALVNPTYPVGLLGRMLADLDPVLVVTDQPHLLRPAASGRRLLDLAELANADPGDPSEAPGLLAGPLALAGFMHTSGTTGVPKFCAQTHRYFLRLGQALADALDLQTHDTVLAPLSLFHINPLGYGVVGALTAGADVLTVRRFSASRFWDTVRDHGVTALVLHAPPVEILKRATTAADAKGHRVRTMFYADGRFMRAFAIPRAVSGYGSTEAAGVSHLQLWHASDDIPAEANRHGGPGRDDIEWRLEEDGQILLRGRTDGVLFSGYQRDGRLDPAIDQDGWFHTGDLGRHAPDGGLVFIERHAESIRVNGEFVPIPHVEEVLGAVPGVVDLALWKRPGDLVDDDPVLYVVADRLPLEDLRTVAARLPPFMRPSAVGRVAALPRDAAAGKVQRRLLAAQPLLAWEEL